MNKPAEKSVSPPYGPETTKFLGYVNSHKNLVDVKFSLGDSTLLTVEEVFAKFNKMLDSPRHSPKVFDKTR